MALGGSRTFWRNEAGAVASTYALALVGLVVMGGVGFDYAHMMGLQSELQNGADQAALAGATQLDGKSGACSRAAGAAINLVTNNTVLSNSGSTITVANEAACDATGNVRFWQDKDRTNAATSDANAHFIELAVDARTANFAFTPLVSLFMQSMRAAAMAGLGSSVCKVPPIMICSPDPSVPFDAEAWKGFGIVATGHNPGNSNNQGGNAGSGSNTTWAPGDFGFLQINDPGDTSNRNAQLLKALAYANPPIDCTPVDGNKVSTGNPQGLYDAINTRFDIYDFPNNGGGNVLSSCQGTNCPPSSNVVKDLVNSNPTGNNGCKFKNGNGNGPGWAFPSAGHEFKPISRTGDTNASYFDDNAVIDVMGLPRDNCHYTSYNGTGLCSNGGTGRFGNGVWDRADYFKVNHTVGGSVDYPPNWQNITRYDTYLWEINNSKIPNGNSATSQRGQPVCYSGSLPTTPDRRVLTIAVVSNCADLHGQSTPVTIDQWVDVFLVEPSSDNSIRYNAFKDAIYVEVIRKSQIAGDGTYASQAVRRDVPYLVR